jgi:hypothetical protein
MKSHRDHKYRPDRPRAHRLRRTAGEASAFVLSTRLRRASSGEVVLALPDALLKGMKWGRRLWMALLHGVVWFTRTPIGPRGAERISRRTRRGPPLRIVRDQQGKRRGALRLKRLRETSPHETDASTAGLAAFSSQDDQEKT